MMQTVYLVEGNKNCHDLDDMYHVAVYFDRQAAELHIQKAEETAARVREIAARYERENPQPSPRDRSTAAYFEIRGLLNAWNTAYWNFVRKCDDGLVWDPNIIDSYRFAPYYNIIEMVACDHPDQWQDAREQQPPR